MNLYRLLGRLLAVFVIVGLVAAPLVTPAAAKRLPVGEMSDMAAMSGDMPCCPDGQKNKSCQDCPLVAICMLAIPLPNPPLPTLIHFSSLTPTPPFSSVY